MNRQLDLFANNSHFVPQGCFWEFPRKRWRGKFCWVQLQPVIAKDEDSQLTVSVTHFIVITGTKIMRNQ